MSGEPRPAPRRRAGFRRFMGGESRSRSVGRVRSRPALANPPPESCRESALAAGSHWPAGGVVVSGLKAPIGGSVATPTDHGRGHRPRFGRGLVVQVGTRSTEQPLARLLLAFEWFRREVDRVRPSVLQEHGPRLLAVPCADPERLTVDRPLTLGVAVTTDRSRGLSSGPAPESRRTCNAPQRSP